MSFLDAGLVLGERPHRTMHHDEETLKHRRSLVSCRKMKRRQVTVERKRRRSLPGRPSHSCVTLSIALLLMALPSCQSFSPTCTYAHNKESSTQLYGIKGFRAWFESQFPNAIMGMNKDGAEERFDHVMIDINQLLHISVRKSKSDDHALTLLMKELNSCVEMARPTKSLVLAMDGSPSAAKLATSRKRRLSTLLKTEWKQKQLQRLSKSKRLSLSQRQVRHLSHKYAYEVETLKITPRTHFMEKANKALLYWAWQKLMSMDGPLANVSIYISTSESPGEGEVKLLDWIFQKQPRGTVAIMGGDSDLVLEGLVIPPLYTHNCFVLLPEKSKRYLVVSLWETTRHLAQLLPQLDSQDIMRIRIDMVLLLILNGNDYLPKLRGSAGFDPVFESYIKVVREWLDEGKENPFLVEPNSLEFHKEFAVDFFSRLKSGRRLDTASDIKNQHLTITPLGQLNNLVSNKFMPKPMTFKLLTNNAASAATSEIDECVVPSNDDDGYGDDDESEEGDKVDDEMLDCRTERSQGDSILQLSLGHEGSDNYYNFEAPFKQDTQIKDVKNALAVEAINYLIGEDFLKDDEVPGLTASGFSWELDVPVECDIEMYLGGLLWNLQTYQDGICSDYGYNYGKRLSPTARELVKYFRTAIGKNRPVTKLNLLGKDFAAPVKNGITCLAAMPSQLSDLMVQPYAKISESEDLVETMYGKCVSRRDNSFDLQKFETLCDIEIAKLDESSAARPMRREGGMKEVELGADFWTVLYRDNDVSEPTFNPPPPMVTGFASFRVNRRIKAKRFKSSPRPRPRRVWDDAGAPKLYDPCNITKLLLGEPKNGRSVFDVDYWTPYASKWPAKKANKKRAQTKQSGKGGSVNIVSPDSGNPRNGATAKAKPKKRTESKTAVSDEQLEERLAEFKMEMDPKEYRETSISGSTPLSYLMHLQDADVIDFEWKSISPSPTDFASFRPGAFECVQLIVRRGDEPLNATFEGELLFQRDRELTRGSKRVLRQYLASQALSRLLAQKRKNWYELDFNDLKNHLLPDYEVVKRPKLSSESIEERMNEFNMPTLGDMTKSYSHKTALEYLNLLDQSKLIRVTFSLVRPSPTDFASASPDDFECVRLVIKGRKKGLVSPVTKDLIFERDRLVGRDLKKVKQHLAGVALTRLLDFQDKPWTDFNYKELKACLRPPQVTTSQSQASSDLV